MNYSRDDKELMERLAHKQAYIFKRASNDKLPAYSFIKMYMCSEKVGKLDKLILVDDDEIYIPIKLRIKRRGRTITPIIMHWIGYIYRCLSYLYNVQSRILYRKVPPKYLLSVYHLYHSQDPIKASQWIYKAKLQNKQTDLERALSLMKQIY